ncbi:MAG: FemAB family PEP-CTERM system-associated protein [Planctomycetota bacterium]
MTIPTPPETEGRVAPHAPTLHRLAETDRGEWTDFVRSHRDSTLFHTLEWADIIERTFQHRHHYLLCRRDDRITGILPMTRVSSAFFGTTLISAPFGVYGGILSEDAETTATLVEGARKVGEEQGAKYVELRHLVRPELELPHNDLYCTFIEDVPDTADGCLQRLPRKARAEVRKCLREDELEMEEESISLEEFHRLFSLNKRKLGSPLFPSSLFWHIRNVLGDRAVMHVVKCRGETVSAVLSFIHGDTLMPYYSGAVAAAERSRANNFMYFRLMEWASERGLARFDFGRSRKETGSFAFKKHQGFEPRPLSYDYILVRADELPSLNPSNPKYEIAKKVFARMPLWMAQKVGSWLVKRAPF